MATAKDYEVLTDLRDQALAKLKEAGVEEALAFRIAEALKEHFRKHWGGGSIYFCKTQDTSSRDWQIFGEWNGKNMRELVRKYDLTENSIYRIIAKCQEEYVAKNQLSMFS